jgi:hypothetical protein
VHLANSFWRLCFRSQYKSRSSREKDKGADDAEDSDDEEALERVSVEDAWLFPVVRSHTHPIFIAQECLPFDSRQFGSFALYGLYMIIKYYGSEWINFVLKWYFVTAGVGSFWAVSIVFSRSFATWYSSSRGSTFAVEYQTLRSLVRFMVGKVRWQSLERHSLRYTKGKSKGRWFSDPDVPMCRIELMELSADFF